MDRIAKEAKAKITSGIGIIWKRLASLFRRRRTIPELTPLQRVIVLSIK